jgi:hypothetical protein
MMDPEILLRIFTSRQEHLTATTQLNKQLVLLFTDFFAITLASQRFLHALLLTRLQIKRVTLDFLDNVFGLHLALKPPQGILKGFAFLYSNLCQKNTPPTTS